MKVQKLLTEFKDLQHFPRNDTSKLTTTNTCGLHGKSPLSKKLVTKMYTIYVLGQYISNIYDRWEGNLIILIFWNFTDM